MQPKLFSNCIIIILRELTNHKVKHRGRSILTHTHTHFGFHSVYNFTAASPLSYYNLHEMQHLINMEKKIMYINKCCVDFPWWINKQIARVHNSLDSSASNGSLGAAFQPNHSHSVGFIFRQSSSLMNFYGVDRRISRFVGWLSPVGYCDLCSIVDFGSNVCANVKLQFQKSFIFQSAFLRMQYGGSWTMLLRLLAAANR